MFKSSEVVGHAKTAKDSDPVICKHIGLNQTGKTLHKYLKRGATIMVLCYRSFLISLFVIFNTFLILLSGCGPDHEIQQEVVVDDSSIIEEKEEEEEAGVEIENEWYWYNETLTNKYTEEEILNFVAKKKTQLDIEEVLLWLQNEGIDLENTHVKDKIYYYFTETVEWSLIDPIERDEAEIDVVLFESDGMLTFLRIRIFFPFEKPRIYEEVVEFYLWFITDALKWTEGRVWFVEAWGNKKNGLYGNKTYTEYKDEYIWIDTTILPASDSLSSIIIESAE